MNGPYNDGQAYDVPEQPEQAPTQRANPQEPTTNEPQRNPPVDTLREGGLKATIWRNEGQNGAYHSVNLSRTYKDDQGNYHDTGSFRAQDKLGLSELSRQAHYRTHDLNREAFKEQRRSEPEPGRDQTRTR